MATLSPPTKSSPFQRVFSESEEILLVKTLYQLNNKVNFSQSSPSRSSMERVIIYNRINRALGMKFTRTQLSEKIRRLRGKYLKQSQRTDLIKNPHGRRMFKLSSKIWGENRTSESENGAATEGDFEDPDDEDDIEEDEVEEENSDNDDDVEEDINKEEEEDESMEQQEENKEGEEDDEAEEEDSDESMEGEKDANGTPEVTDGSGGVTGSNGGVAEANGGVAEAGGGVTESNGGVTKSNGGVAEANGGVAEACGGLTESNGGVNEANGGVAEANGGVAETNRESGEAYGGGFMEWSKEKEEVVLKKYPSLVSEFTKSYPDKTVWHEAFDLLGAEKLREMNEEWLLVRIQEASLMARKAELLHQQSKLQVEAFKSRSK